MMVTFGALLDISMPRDQKSLNPSWVRFRLPPKFLQGIYTAEKLEEERLLFTVVKLVS